MIDFPFSTPSVFLSLYVWGFFLVIYFAFNKKYVVVGCKNNYSTDKKFITLLFIFIVTHCVNGDFFHYLDRVHILGKNPQEAFGQEAFHTDLAVFLKGNYLLYRIIVWGGSLMMMTIMAKRFKLQYTHMLFIFFSLYVFFFSYARASMAMSAYFLGISFLAKPIDRHKILSYLLGVGIIVLSYKFHISILVAIALTPIVLVPINKYSIISLFVLFPLLLGYFGDYMQLLLIDENVIGDEYLYDKFSRYSDRESTAGITRQIIDAFTLCSYYIPFAFETYYLKFKKIACDRYVSWFYNIALGLLLISICFSMVEMEADKIGDRIRIISFIPIVVVLEYLREYNILSKKNLIRIVYIGIIAQSLRYLYSMYLT